MPRPELCRVTSKTPATTRRTLFDTRHNSRRSLRAISRSGKGRCVEDGSTRHGTLPALCWPESKRDQKTRKLCRMRVGRFTAQALEKKRLLDVPYPSARHNSGREIMPQRVGRIGLGDACQLQVAGHAVADLPGTERQAAFARHAAGKDIGRRRGLESLPLPEGFGNIGREIDHAIHVAFTVIDA